MLSLSLHAQRTFTRALLLKSDQQALSLGVFLTTFFFAFAIPAAASVYLHWLEDPLVEVYRSTLSYTSALVGDAILIPLLNVFIFQQLRTWNVRIKAGDVIGALTVGALLTLGVHLYQGQNELLNWTMPEPFVWTVIGYLHAFFMAAELALVLFFWTSVAYTAQARGRAFLSIRVLAVLFCCIVFIRLLLGDYGYIL